MNETHPEKRLLGYARVSSYGQTLDSQLEQLRKTGCNGRNIYREKATGARPDRCELNRMLRKLAPGDVVTVTRIDGLARSTFDVFGIVKRIVDAKAEFRSLAEPWADSTSSTGRLMLAVLGGLADVERDLIKRCKRNIEITPLCKHRVDTPVGCGGRGGTVAVLSMSKPEFIRLDVLLRVQSGSLRVGDACVLIGLQRRQVFRLLRGLKQEGPGDLGPPLAQSGNYGKMAAGPAKC